MINTQNRDGIRASILSKDLWILDPYRILLDLGLDFLENPKYLTVGNGL
jgi:hypothetical protein